MANKKPTKPLPEVPQALKEKVWTAQEAFRDARKTAELARAAEARAQQAFLDALDACPARCAPIGNRPVQS